ncbi:hypothetical protein ILUMI_03255 [Ignelater luminosus]|uniref:Reverse transcriptase n=1 Tax=Ignelater luminosus TaxID=2038154 RepID=A0A8K0DEW9_IGNLU|nr:hypothetical protein ILUMI_03255 [Ignelater luminosus]
MEKRRQQKGHNTQKYREIHKVVKRKIREAKQRYQERGRKRQQGIIKDKDGNLIIDFPAKLNRWEEYIRELQYDARAERDNIDTTEMANKLRITSQEIEFAIINVRVNKTAGPDQIPVELIKLIEGDQIQILADLFNTIYRTGVIPEEWLRSTFVVLPKSVNARECNLDFEIIWAQERNCLLKCNDAKM